MPAGKGAQRNDKLVGANPVALAVLSQRSKDAHCGLKPVHQWRPG